MYFEGTNGDQTEEIGEQGHERGLGKGLAASEARSRLHQRRRFRLPRLLRLRSGDSALRPGGNCQIVRADTSSEAW